MTKTNSIRMYALLVALGAGGAGGVGAQVPPQPAGDGPGRQEQVAGSAAQNFSLKDAAQAAVLKSPEVLARWHAFREASEEVGVARGGFLPRLDFSAGSGKQKQEQDNVKPRVDTSYSGNDRQLTLRQMLFDGLATSSEVKRLGKAKLTRYFELLDASENVALEAGRAYLDVVRFRYQVFLAEENYIQHQAAYEQLRQRAASGVGKRVDVDQAASRLALADINLTTAYANLHDVAARYTRIVGEQPAKVMFAPAQLAKGGPASAEAALREGLQHNPALRASIENIEASQYQLEGSRAPFMPRLDLVASRNNYSNYQDGGPREENKVELRMNFNLFNGGSDAARNRQYRERKNTALDLREKACRDVRQTLAIAYNETLRLNDQLSFIGMQVGLLEKTRAAYRDQFNIGQRSLLDLLNTQNEYFDARRSQVNADADLAIAYLRTYASMGRLLEKLELKHVEDDAMPDSRDFASVDAAELCPPVAPADTTLDREALARKTREMLEDVGGGLVGSRPAALNAPQPARPVAPVPAVEPLRAVPADEVQTRTTAWVAAWAARDLSTYLGFYAPEFKPEGGVTREAWARQRELRIAKAGDISLEIGDLSVKAESADAVTVTFRQGYAAGSYRDVCDKTLEWKRVNAQWLIVRETAQSVAKGQ